MVAYPKYTITEDVTAAQDKAAEKMKHIAKVWSKIPFRQGFSRILNSYGSELGLRWEAPEDKELVLFQTGKLRRALARPSIEISKGGANVEVYVTSKYFYVPFFGRVGRGGHIQPPRHYMGWTEWLINEAYSAFEIHYDDAISEAGLD